MMQGDQYYIPIKGSGFEISDVEKIEFVIGKLVKNYPETVTYDSDREVFLFPITQEETLRMSGKVETQVRVKFRDSDDVIGVRMCEIDVKKSLTDTEL